MGLDLLYMNTWTHIMWTENENIYCITCTHIPEIKNHGKVSSITSWDKQSQGMQHYLTWLEPTEASSAVCSGTWLANWLGKAAEADRATAAVLVETAACWRGVLHRKLGCIEIVKQAKVLYM